MSEPLPEAIMYHYVRDADAQPAVGYAALDVGAFEAQLDAVCRVATPIGWPRLADALAGRQGLPTDAVVLTFDDGLADHHRVVLPALVARGLPAIFFVLARDPRDGLALGHRLHVLLAVRSAHDIRDAVLARLAPPDARRYAALEAGLRARSLSDPDDAWKRPLQRELELVADPILAELVADWVGPEDEVAAALYLDERDRQDLVDAGMSLGGHGRQHPWLDALDEPAMESEIAHSARLLARYGPGPWAFAYPYGGVPRNPGAPLADHGFGAAFTTRAGVRPDRFHIGRHDADEIGRAPLPAGLGRST